MYETRIYVPPTEGGIQTDGEFRVLFAGEPMHITTVNLAMDDSPFGPRASVYFGTPIETLSWQGVGVFVMLGDQPGRYELRPENTEQGAYYSFSTYHMGPEGGFWSTRYSPRGGHIQLDMLDPKAHRMSGSFSFYILIENRRHDIEGSFDLRGHPDDVKP